MRILFFLVLSVILSLPAVSFAAQFTCYNPTSHEPTGQAPNVGFMLDRSGSMEDAASGGISGSSRWEESSMAINESVSDYEAKVRFGLSFFSSMAFQRVPAMPNAASAISAALIGEGDPKGGTVMGKAGKNLENDVSLNSADRSNHAIFITDGYPTFGGTHEGARNTFVEAIQALCRASDRANPLSTNAIGFGDGVNPQIINMMATAGGNGTCCNPENCESNPINICNITDSGRWEELLPDYGFIRPNGNIETTINLDPNKIRCEGGYVIHSGTQLKAKIDEIVSAAACVFPLDLPADYPGNQAKEDPNYTLVQIDHKVHGAGPIAIQNIGDCANPNPTPAGIDFPSPEYDGEGWCFVNDRRSIQLTSKFCAEIGLQDIEKVVTEVACICKLTGEECKISTVLCNGGTCSDEQIDAMPCSKGEYVCHEGIDVCEGTGVGALPEICNGIDDNCDGLIDNMSDSKQMWTEAIAADTTLNDGIDDPMISTDDDINGKHCSYQNVCQCEPNYEPKPGVNGSVRELLQSWTDSCTCQAGLGFDEEPVSEEQISVEPSSEQEKTGACSALGQGSEGLLYLLIPLGLVGLFRRRKS